jgi:hypothetical protein
MEYSLLHSDVAANGYLLSRPPFVKVHDACYRTYISKRRHEQQEGNEFQGKMLRSSVDSFDFKPKCFICGKLAVVDSKHPDRCAVSSVCTKSIYAKMLKLCRERGDHWAFEVQGRLETINDLISVEAVYHRNCHQDFSKINLTKQDNQLPGSF